MLFRALDRLLTRAPDPAHVAWIGQWTYAHRGLHKPGVPENSLAAFAGAIAAGYGIECDIQRSREILDELYRRAGERQRPESERDYIERLLRWY